MPGLFSHLGFWLLVLAQVIISGSWCWAPCVLGSVLSGEPAWDSLPLTLPLCAVSRLCLLSLSNKWIKSLKKIAYIYIAHLVIKKKLFIFFCKVLGSWYFIHSCWEIWVHLMWLSLDLNCSGKGSKVHCVRWGHAVCSSPVLVMGVVLKILLDRMRKSKTSQFTLWKERRLSASSLGFARYLLSHCIQCLTQRPFCVYLGPH